MKIARVSHIEARQATKRQFQAATHNVQRRRQFKMTNKMNEIATKIKSNSCEYKTTIDNNEKKKQ